TLKHRKAQLNACWFCPEDTGDIFHWSISLYSETAGTPAGRITRGCFDCVKMWMSGGVRLIEGAIPNKLKIKGTP
ncbi:MAG TPA: hypothetical protein V6C65_32895, partial [Allocoleopsis sp.]